MTLHERCLAFARAFPDRPDSWPRVSPTGRWIYAHWVVGALFKNASDYHGAYPRGYVAQVRALFPDVREQRILHLFAGSVPKSKATRLDIRADLGVEIVGDVYDLPRLIRPDQFDLVLADPPYSEPDAQRYGQAMVDRARVFRTMADALRPGTFVAWLDVRLPMYRKDAWHNFADIDLRRSTNHARRAVLLFERRAA